MFGPSASYSAGRFVACSTAGAVDGGNVNGSNKRAVDVEKVNALVVVGADNGVGAGCALFCTRCQLGVELGG